MRFPELMLAFQVTVWCVGLSILLLPGIANSTSLHLTASSPWYSFADPLAQDSGVPLLPAIFDALTVIEANGEVTPALAESWSHDSETVWTFRLRSGVVFSDGTLLDADAVVECLSMLIGPAGAAYAPARYVRGISDVRALSNEVIEITTHQKEARLARNLSNVHIFSVAAFEHYGRTEFSKFPVGTGPYEPESWASDGKGVVLTYVPTSWRKSRGVDRVEIIVVPDSTARLQNMLSGGTDISSNLDPDSIPTIEMAGYKVSVKPAPIILSLALRTNGDAASPLHDRRVRLSLNMAIDRESISQHLLRGTMEPATQFATPEALGFDPTIEAYPFDRDRAKRLLAEAGYENGFALKGMIMAGAFPGDTLIFQQVVQDLALIGVKVELSNLPVMEYMRRRLANTWDGVGIISSLLSHYRQGDISMAAELFTCVDPRSTFCDPAMEIDDLLSASDQEMDPLARERLLKSLNARLHYLAPAILISRYAAVDALSKRVVTLPDFPAGKMRFEEIEVVED